MFPLAIGGLFLLIVLCFIYVICFYHLLYAIAYKRTIISFSQQLT